MSSEGSEQMLTLLKELSVYKALDGDYKDGAPRVELKQKPMRSASGGGRR
jgi:hypothetical protein